MNRLRLFRRRPFGLWRDRTPVTAPFLKSPIKDRLEALIQCDYLVGEVNSIDLRRSCFNLA